MGEQAAAELIRSELIAGGSAKSSMLLKNAQIRPEFNERQAAALKMIEIKAQEAQAAAEAEAKAIAEAAAVAEAEANAAAEAKAAEIAQKAAMERTVSQSAAKPKATK